MNPAIRRANKEIDKELNKLGSIIYAATAYILWIEYGWREERIMKLLKHCDVICDECQKHGTDKSLLQMLEDETGIELQIEGCEQSFHDLAYLDPAKWDGKPPTEMQLLYMRQRQKRWLAPMMISCVCLGLYRKEGWGAQRVGRFVQQIGELRHRLGDKSHRPYVELLEKETRIHWSEMGTTHQR